ncbi:MAG: transcriptional regulator [Alphaproteobacteria bacterium HGW-Alphaproteobacteria-9]|nr:MAG: transcriptional regulator [Alphaproteobacteria bacterium HGW-Alphaproteobacteria-9]
MTPASAPERSPRSDRRHLELARKTYSLRRKRAVIFGNPELFGEPAWDILLDLFIAQAENKPVSVSSACIGSAAAATTGLRWLGVLADEGLIVRENDSGDNRRVLVRLSNTGVKAMERFFDAVEASL